MDKANKIIKNSTYKVPIPVMIPVNGRLLCTAIDPSEVKTASGIIIPGQQTKLDKDDRIKNLPRYIVAAAAADAFILDGKGNPVYQIQPGDEVYPFWPEDAIDFYFPIVFDYGCEAYFTTIHISELVGYVPKIEEK